MKYYKDITQSLIQSSKCENFINKIINYADECYHEDNVTLTKDDIQIQAIKEIIDTFMKEFKPIESEICALISLLTAYNTAKTFSEIEVVTINKLTTIYNLNPNELMGLYGMIMIGKSKVSDLMSSLNIKFCTFKAIYELLKEARSAIVPIKNKILRGINQIKSSLIEDTEETKGESYTISSSASNGGQVF